MEYIQTSIKEYAIIITSFVAIFTLIKGFLEYRLNSKQKRGELYAKFRNKWEENDSIRKVVDALENDDDIIVKEIPRIEKYIFIGFYEDLSILINTGLIKPEIAHYMFSYYAIKCWNNDVFWEHINRDALYWRVFREFVEKMIELEKTQMTIANNKNLKFMI